MLLRVISAFPPCTIVMEACSTVHFWRREFARLGHTVKLIPPQYVKPYVKTNKNDAADAEAITEAASRPSMRFTAVKTVAQQDIQILHRTRDRLVKARTALVNSLRSLCAEYGMAIPQGLGWLNRNLANTRQLLEATGSSSLLDVFERTLGEYRRIEEDIKAYEMQLRTIAASHPVAQRLMQIPGVGVLAATACLASVTDPKEFRNGRHFSAFLGLVPRQHATGGKERLLGISKRGNQYLRRILVSGAQSVLRWSTKKPTPLNTWVTQLRARKPWNAVAVALANKNARVMWHLLRHEVDFIPKRAAA